MFSYRKYLTSLVLGSFISLSSHATTTKNAEIIDSHGNKVALKGINWFGFNNGDTMVGGLWQPNSLSGDFQTVAQRIKALGFNAVRLPFSFSEFRNTPRNYVYSNCNQVSIEDIKSSLINPQYQSANEIPKSHLLNYTVPRTKNDVCNSDLPNDNVRNRLIYVAQFFAKNNIYVLLDNHLREDQTILKDGIESWSNEWKNLAQELKTGNSEIDQYFMFDLLNEPDNFGIRWEQSSANPSLGEAYLAAMDKLYPVMPDSLFFIEGTGQGNINANWGDGFATDPQVIQQYGLSDPNPFFKALMKKPYLNNVVVSPHVYPSSVAGESSKPGKELYQRLTTSFGYLTQEGYCSEGKCHQFPIAVGEFGSKFETNDDIEFLKDFASYLNNTDEGKDNKHKQVANWFYWDWNANSGDTGGIVQDDWFTIHWNKVDYLTSSNKNTNGLGLIPWYVQAR